MHARLLCCWTATPFTAMPAMAIQGTPHLLLYMYQPAANWTVQGGCHLHKEAADSCMAHSSHQPDSVLQAVLLHHVLQHMSLGPISSCSTGKSCSTTPGLAGSLQPTWRNPIVGLLRWCLSQTRMPLQLTEYEVHVGDSAAHLGDDVGYQVDAFAVDQPGHGHHCYAAR